MEYACSVCEYTSSIKTDVIRHINRKKSCGSGNKEVVEIPIDIICEFCNKTFSTKAHLKDHIKKRCKQKDTMKDAIKIKEQAEKIKELEMQLKERQTTIINNTNNTNNTNNNTNNTTNNNCGNTYNIMVNNYENTSLEKVTDAIINKLINDTDEVYQIIPRFIKEVHFNPNIPENHNVYISSKDRSNKYIILLRHDQWEIENKNTEVDNIIYDKETNISDWVGRKGKEYPEAAEKFNEYKEQKFEPDVVKLVREGTEQVLYNNRYIVTKHN